MTKVLLLEDDAILSREIRDYLNIKGFQCTMVADGVSFLQTLRAEGPFDLMLLDINVPQLNGLEVCRSVRANDSQVPILMLTAYGELQDKSEAFGLGADDYLVKPFHLEELLLRIQAVLRRRDRIESSDSIIVIGDLMINEDAAEVIRSGIRIDLTPKEFQLLLALAKARGRVMSKQQLAEKVWDIQHDTAYNTIEVYINFLRKKIDKPFSKKLIHTRSGFGYFLRGDN
jgi:DNA-binding response OmpR family regulator